MGCCVLGAAAGSCCSWRSSSRPRQAQLQPGPVPPVGLHVCAANRCTFVLPTAARPCCRRLRTLAANRCTVCCKTVHAPPLLQGRYSFVGATPELEIVARGQQVHILDHRKGSRETIQAADPMQVRAARAVLPWQAGCCAGRMGVRQDGD